ncbi:MAG: ERAP1-like C-terminal domain-containing protein, partial [Candidatus Saccharimonadales bacterium]
FPIVRASVDQELLTYQQRFFLNPEASKNHERVDNWPVPLLPSIKLPNDLTSQPSYKTKIPASSKPLMLNQNHSGFYRTIYNPGHLEKLAKAVKSGQLSPLDRMGLLSDITEAAKAGQASTIDALKLLEAYSNEDNSVVWDIIAGLLGSIRHVMNDELLRENMKPFSRKLVAEQLARLGWKSKPNESHFDSLLRPLILSLASFSEEPNVVNEALSRFEKMKTTEDLEPDLRGVIYGTAARKGHDKYFEKMLKLHDSVNNSEERVVLSSALTGFKNPALIDRALAHINTDKVRLQDASYWIAYSFMNRHARDKTWDWMIKNWGWLEKNLGSDLSFYRFPVYAARAY